VLAPTEAPSRWRDLRTRVLSAAILGPAAIACVWFGGVPFEAMVVLASCGLGIEWADMCGERGLTLSGLGVPAGCLVVGAVAAFGWTALALALIPIAALAAYAVASDSANRVSLALGVPYFGLGAVALIWLRDDPDVGRANLVILLVLIWASDIGAYMVGRACGGPKLAPAISPGKTWSGAMGGLLSVMVVGLVAVLMVSPSGTVAGGTVWRAIIIAAGFGIAAQLGDLLESLIKRHFGVKDSGWLIPGHGGLLDRVDALLAAAPLAAGLALLVGRGVVLWQ
jgi:phosphatidate cytidylyltransferase